MVTRRIIYLLSVAGCLLFFLSYRLWFGWFALMVILFLPLLSLLLSLYSMLTCRLDLNLPRHTRTGLEVVLTPQCSHPLPVPPWRCKVVVERPMTGEKWTLTAGDPLPTDRAGALKCRVKKARIYDYLGLFSMPMKHTPTATIHVLPDPIPTKMPALDRFIVQSWRPKWGGGFAENHELRLYRPGDNVQQIHWKLSAKTGNLIFRQPMDPIRNRLCLRLELSGTALELERKLGRLRWLSQQLLQKELQFQVQVTAAGGPQSWDITDPDSFARCLDELLWLPCLSTPSAHPTVSASWQIWIGGEAQ